MESNEYRSIMPSYPGSSVLKPRPFYHTGLEKGLERIIFDESAETGKDEVCRIFSDKSRTLKATIKALFNEIMLRERLDSFLLYSMDKDICKQHNYLERLKEFNRFNYSQELLKDFHDEKMKVEDNVLGLQKDKRKEYLECWKDLMGLKKYLLSALKDYWNASNRGSFLNVENDKHRGNLQETETYNWQ